ncbi:MAG TPA: hypothetical protein VFR11_10335 [Micromonosporaceae bacterium]|jgi:hypothetical protein|nr:hypothetical protein [Micromonosporaceae bacterium]
MSPAAPRPPEPSARPFGGELIDVDEEPPPAGLRPMPWRMVGAVAALVATVLIGYIVGNQQGRAEAVAAARTPAAAPSSTAPLGAISGTGVTCSLQQGALLRVGVRVANQSLHDVTLDRITVGLPGNDLDLVATAWGPCTSRFTTTAPGNRPLPAGATTWVSAVVVVHASCPATYPVEFTVAYDGGQTKVTAGFSDLGNVPATACDVAP